MPVNTNSDFNLTRNQIETLALNEAGIVGIEQTVSAATQSFASNMLNMLMMSWKNQGKKVWTEFSGTLFLESGINTYNLGSTAHFYDTDTLVTTSISSNEALGQTVLSVTDNSDISATMIVGIVLDDSTIQWTTVSSVGVGTITVAAALTAASATGNAVYASSGSLGRPLDLISVQSSLSGTERILSPLGRPDYFNLPNKGLLADQVNQYYYNPNRDSFGTLRIYPTPNTISSQLKLQGTRSLFDFDTSTDLPDLPNEWILALVLNLAVLLCPAYGKDQKLASLQPLAAAALAAAETAAVDEADIWIRNEGLE